MCYISDQYTGSILLTPPLYIVTSMTPITRASQGDEVSGIPKRMSQIHYGRIFTGFSDSHVRSFNAHLLKTYTEIELQAGLTASIHAYFLTANLGDQASQKRVAGDVEWNTEAHVARALIHLAGQFAVGHVELTKHMARRQSHFLERSGVPSC